MAASVSGIKLLDPQNGGIGIGLVTGVGQLVINLAAAQQNATGRRIWRTLVGNDAAKVA